MGSSLLLPEMVRERGLFVSIKSLGNVGLAVYINLIYKQKPLKIVYIFSTWEHHARNVRKQLA